MALSSQLTGIEAFRASPNELSALAMGDVSLIVIFQFVPMSADNVASEG